MTATIVICVVSGALILGALWGLYGSLSDRVEGFIVAMAGGALIVSAMSELIEPAIEHAPLWLTMGAVALGALTFTLLDNWVDNRFGEDSGGGMFLVITLDGIPENLALGVALIGAGAGEVAALAGAIFLSNLPEAAGGAKQMREAGYKARKILALWVGAAIVLSLAAVIGNWALAGAETETIAVIQCIAAGAVAAALATEIFPRAYKQEDDLTGIAVAVGLIFAVLLGQLSG